MNKQNMKKFVKERNEMLLKCDVNELRKFVQNNGHLYGEEFLIAFGMATDDVLEVTLHKMIVNVPSLPEELRKQSAVWLALHGYDLNV